MVRSALALLLAALLACVGTPRVVSLRAKGAPEVVHVPASGGSPLQVSDPELRGAMGHLAPAVPTPLSPLGWAERLFEVPPRSGTYLYETRTHRLLPVEAGGPLVGATSIEELARDYLEWCGEDREAGDCLGLLKESSGEFSSHARYAVAMAIGWRAVLEPMRKSLRDMVPPRAVEASILSAMAMYLMLLEADQAGDFQELRKIGKRFGEATGPGVAKLVMLVVTAAVGTGGGLAARGASLPGFFQASQQAELVGGIRLAMAGTVEAVTVGQSTVTISLAPGALAMAAGNSSGGGSHPTHNAENFRKNLVKLTGQEPPNAHAHHVFPQKWEDFFAARGINIHDPRFGAWWSAEDHVRLAGQDNAEWQAFFARGPRTLAEILDFARQLAKDYGFQVLF